MNRNKVIRIGAIVIVLALLMSLIAGAISITPSQAAPISAATPAPNVVAPIDTDGDGVPNNEDPDIDNDGLVNANDNDIDGDGIANFDDGDPAATNGFDGKTPRKPDTYQFQELAENGSFWWLGAGLIALIGVGVLVIRKTLQKRGKNR